MVKSLLKRSVSNQQIFQTIPTFTKIKMIQTRGILIILWKNVIGQITLQEIAINMHNNFKCSVYKSKPFIRISTIPCDEKFHCICIPTILPVASMILHIFLMCFSVIRSCSLKIARAGSSVSTIPSNGSGNEIWRENGSVPSRKVSTKVE